MSDQHVTIRVNSARLPEYLGRSVRLVCKVIRMDGNNAIVEASDGGQIQVKLPPDSNMSDTFVEIIGRVETASMIKMQACANMGSDLDMKLVDNLVNFTHDSRFQSMFN